MIINSIFIVKLIYCKKQELIIYIFFYLNVFNIWTIISIIVFISITCSILTLNTLVLIYMLIYLRILVKLISI
jgi:hypothetical protein